MDKEIQLSVKLLTIINYTGNIEYSHSINDIGTLYYIPNSDLPFTFNGVQSTPIEYMIETKKELLIKTMHTKYTFEKL